MNLFIDDLGRYLRQEWDRVLRGGTGSGEARFIVQSLDPNGTLDLFTMLDAHRRVWEQQRTIRCYFRVATGLWQAWEAAGAADVAVQALRAQGWIDEDDQLTWYRNRMAADELVDALVVVLVGLNHATDQGGLADFHQVDEHRLLRALGGSFQPWLQRICERLSLSPSDLELTRLDAVIQQLFALRPLRLGRLAAFLEPLVAQGSCYSMAELRGRLFAALPFWDLPPLLPDGHGKLPTDQQAVKALKGLDDFFSHQTLKTPAGQKKAWRKLEPWLAQKDFVPPVKIDGTDEFTGPDDYRGCLEAFIGRADPVARTRLLRVDGLAMVKALGAPPEPGKPKPPKETIPAFSDLAFTALLRGVWSALCDFAKDQGDDGAGWLAIAGIQVDLEAFHHDLSGDEDAGEGPEVQARRLLRGCLGGLDRLFEQMTLSLPANETQAEGAPEAWDRRVPMGLALRLDDLALSAGRASAKPFVQFRVKISDTEGRLPIANAYRWYLEPTQPERVRLDCAERVRQRWDEQTHPERLLPAFRIDEVGLTAMYFAADGDEANRLLSQAVTDLELLDLAGDLGGDALDPALRRALRELGTAYQEWLKHYVPVEDDATPATGWFNALLDHSHKVQQAYEQLAERVLDPALLGASELLRRLYKAFLLVDTRAAPNDAYLRAAVAWGLSPAVLELCAAQARFLADGFPEVVTELVRGGRRRSNAVFDRLLDLARIQRPMTALVTGPTGQLSTRNRSFGLLHCLGDVPKTARGLAVQTLLREDSDGDDEGVRDLILPCEEQAVLERVLDLYLRLNAHAHDGLRILAVHVEELPTILAGVHAFLKRMLRLDKTDPQVAGLPPFYCTVMVYSTSSSPLAMENGLARWRAEVEEGLKETDRRLVLSVGHRFAPKDRIVELLERERLRYDIAFLFHFLRGAMAGRVEPAEPYAVGDGISAYFPIAEYPRPIRAGDGERRQMLLSNRRLRVQTRHSDLSARLGQGGHERFDAVVYGVVDFGPWQGIVTELHARAQWVACVDAFVDKWLVGGAGPDRPEGRKIVGFESGLGAYGELNLTISTQHDGLDLLERRLTGELTGLLPQQAPAELKGMAKRIVADAEAIIGLASLRAVLGQGEQLREVIGFSAIARLWQAPAGQMSQLLPLDALRHWLADAETKQRADLLALTLELRPDDVPLIHAAVLECKLGHENPVRRAEAVEQVCVTLQHLIRLFAPRHTGGGRAFDRRYWWGQLQRAIATRARVNLPDRELHRLDHALEQLAEGRYEVCWYGLAFTFWDNQAMPTPEQTPIAPPDLTGWPLPLPPGFAVQHVALGHQGLAALFDKAEPERGVGLQGPAICLRPGSGDLAPAPWGSDSDDGDADDEDADDELIIDDEPEPEPPAMDDATEPGVSPEPQSARQRSLNLGGAAGESDTLLATPTLSSPVSISASIGLAGMAALSGQPSGEGRASEPAPAADPRVSGAMPDTKREPGPSVPERILIGTRKSGEPVYWHFGDKRLPNRHLLVFGTSGSGKTYGIQCLLAEMAALGLRSLIIDYTNGFLPAQMQPRFVELAAPKSHFVRHERLPLNPFRRQRQVLDPSLPAIEEDAYNVATRIQSIFASVYGLGDQQAAALIRSLQGGLEASPAFALDDLLGRLRDDSSYGESLANKIEPLIQARPFREGDASAWEAMLTSAGHRVHVLQLAGLAREIQKLVTEFVLWDLWDYAQSTGSEARPIPIVLDEVQNLDHNDDSPIDKMLREGRKLGVALLLATQTTSNFTSAQRDRLFQAGHKLFFKPATTETDRFAQILAQATPGLSKADWVGRLAKLEKGQCWSLGPVLRSDGSFREEAVLVRVTALEERQFDG
jgi:DNA phosphorothioation-dependent restriction protein DptH